MIASISAVTLAAHNMARAVAFYRMLGFEIVHGGDDAAFKSFRAGTSFLNLLSQAAERNWSWEDVSSCDDALRLIANATPAICVVKRQP